MKVCIRLHQLVFRDSSGIKDYKRGLHCFHANPPKVLQGFSGPPDDWVLHVDELCIRPHALK